MIKKSKKIFILLSFLFFLTMGSVSLWLVYWFEHPCHPDQQAMRYYVPEGSSFSKVIYTLAKKDLVCHPSLFLAYVKLTHFSHKIKIGTYDFSSQDSPKSILQKLIEGKTVTVKVTFPEGLNQYQVAEKLASIFPKMTMSSWLDLMQSKDLLMLLPLEDQPKNLEGFLYPETYFWDPNEPPLRVLKQMISMFGSKVTPQMMAQAKSLGLSPVSFVTFASIVEKESASNEERKKIAAVYWNRLKKHMKLQADPTVAYGAWQGEHHLINQKDLDAKNAYNTYIINGLPQGPIANPSQSSFDAVLHPAACDALYFVATGDGTHVFAKSYKEHQKNVRKYLKFLKKHRQKK